jgi:hypothetical protein
MSDTESLTETETHGKATCMNVIVAQCLTYCLQIQEIVRASTVACVQCAACVGDLHAMFMTVGSYRAQSPEHEDLSEELPPDSEDGKSLCCSLRTLRRLYRRFTCYFYDSGLLPGPESRAR